MESGEPGQKQASKTDLEVKNASQENVSKVSEIKARLSVEIQKIEKSMTEISNIKQESIQKIELKKKELRELSGCAEVCKEKDETLKEMKIKEIDIRDRKNSITLLDQTIANLDKQIAQIQAEHDRATAELNLKKRKLNEKLQYYDLLNERLTALLELLQKECTEHEIKLNDLLRERSEILKRTDLSETTLNKMIAELDGKMDILNKEHENIMTTINKKLSDIEVSEADVIEQLEVEEQSLTSKIPEVEEPILTEEQIQELEEFERHLSVLIEPRLTLEERSAIILSGLHITSSGNIITKDDRVLSLEDARNLGLVPSRLSLEEKLCVLRNSLEFTESGRILTQDGTVISLEDAREIGLIPSHISSEERAAILHLGLQITPSGRIITQDNEVITLEEARGRGLIPPQITLDERASIFRNGLQITPSGTIVTKDGQVISLEEARLHGLLGDLEEEEEDLETERLPLQSEAEKKFYVSTPSEISSSTKSSSVESELDSRDMDYLKQVFGKSLSLALAEITAVQPSDPIHYLAHWFIKYRYNQEIDEVKRLEIQALMIEREKLEAERWHAELEEEAYLAVLEALFRAENIIRQQDYKRLEMFQDEMEGEYETDFNPMDFFT